MVKGLRLGLIGAWRPWGRRLDGGRRLFVVSGSSHFPFSLHFFGLRTQTLTRKSKPALIVAVVAVFVRSCFRVAELKGGFNGSLANDEVTFMILEGAMVSIAALAMTVVHPGFVFGQYWKLKLANRVLSPSNSIEMQTGLDGKPPR